MTKIVPSGLVGGTQTSGTIEEQIGVRKKQSKVGVTSSSLSIEEQQKNKSTSDVNAVQAKINTEQANLKHWRSRVAAADAKGKDSSRQQKSADIASDRVYILKQQLTKARTGNYNAKELITYALQKAEGRTARTTPQPISKEVAAQEKFVREETAKVDKEITNFRNDIAGYSAKQKALGGTNRPKWNALDDDIAFAQRQIRGLEQGKKSITQGARFGDVTAYANARARAEIANLEAQQQAPSTKIDFSKIKQGEISYDSKSKLYYTRDSSGN